MQADHRMFHSGDLQDLVQSCQLARCNPSPGFTDYATVEADDSPVAAFNGSAVKKRWLSNRLAHEIRNIMVAGQAVNGQLESAKQPAKVLICHGAVILNQVSSNDDEVCAPRPRGVVRKDIGQGRERGSATQSALGVGEQVRVRQVQNPEQC